MSIYIVYISPTFFFSFFLLWSLVSMFPIKFTLTNNS
jgi:hypothetical protein